MRIETVTVSVGYADFLFETARHNRGLFDRWVIVTEPTDKETREVCRQLNLEVVLTDDFRRSGGFDKARGINRGLNVLSADAWRLHLDADIVLPPNFRLLLEAAHPDPQCIYGFDRVLLRSWEEWKRLEASGSWLLFWDYHCRLDAPPFPLGTRWAAPHTGWVPIGYAQLWHAGADEWRGIRQRKYPENHSNAARCDVQFALLWDRRERVLLPEVMCLHLESERAEKGANWNGRTTARFGPERSKVQRAGAS